MLYQLQKNPGERDRIIDEIRKRGIGFPLTPGLLGLTATKSGNDSLLRHTLEERTGGADPTAPVAAVGQGWLCLNVLAKQLWPRPSTCRTIWCCADHAVARMAAPAIGTS